MPNLKVVRGRERACIPTFVELCLQHFPDADRDLLTRGFERAVLNRRLGSACRAYILEKDDKPIGYAIAHIHEQPFFDGQYACLESVYVVEEFRRRKYGKVALARLTNRLEVKQFNALISRQAEEVCETAKNCGFDEKGWEVMCMTPPPSAAYAALEARRTKSQNFRHEDYGECTVTLARQQDVEALADLTIEFEKEMAERNSAFKRDSSAWQSFLRGVERSVKLADPYYGVPLLLKHDGNVVGSARVVLEFSPQLNFHIAYLRRVYVAKDYRRSGMLAELARAMVALTGCADVGEVRSLVGYGKKARVDGVRKAFQQAGFSPDPTLTCWQTGLLGKSSVADVLAPIG